MIRTRIRRLLAAEPFEPFRIKLVNQDHHDIFDPQTASFERDVNFIASEDQNWAMFPFSKINSIESLIADYHGQAAAHGAE
jgi:hypothetical protein